MWLLFKPDGPASQWVPLRQVAWHWDGAGTLKSEWHRESRKITKKFHAAVGQKSYGKCQFKPLEKPMKTKPRWFLIVMASMAGMHSTLAQPTLGIVPTNNQIILFWPANAGGSNGVLQSSSQLTPANWTTVTDAIPFNCPSQTAVALSSGAAARFPSLTLVPPTADGMALVPAGSFTMGDTLDGESDAIPTNIYVSGFYMDTNLVSYRRQRRLQVRGPPVY